MSYSITLDTTLSNDGYIDCKSVEALNKLNEILQIKYLEKQDYLLEHLPPYITNFILKDDVKLVDILSRKWKERDCKTRKVFRDSIGQILLNKLENAKGSYSKYCKWYDLDKSRAQIIIASCLDKGEIDDILFRGRFQTRVKSSLKLTEHCKY